MTPRLPLLAALLGVPAALRAADAPATGGPNPFFMILIVGVVMYVIVIRPQRKEEKQRKEMLSKLKKHDYVLTSSGIYGTVANLSDDEVVLKVDDSKDVRIRFARSAVARVVDAKEGEKKAG